MIILDAPLSIEAAAGDGKKGPRRFEMLAYSGGELVVAGYPFPVVIDLAGMSFRSAKLPVYSGHHDGSDGSKLVGHSDRHDTSSGKLVMAGAMSAATQAKREIVDAADHGYEWQASVGAEPIRGSLEDVPAGKTVHVNGQAFTGPIVVARKSILRHVAILPEGADSETKLWFIRLKRARMRLVAPTPVSSKLRQPEKRHHTSLGRV